MSDKDVLRLGLRELGRRLRAGEISSVALTEAALRRTAATEPVLRAFVVVLTEEARAAAREADRELAAGADRGPLHGIPVAIKDIFDVAGVPTRCGSRARQHAAPARTDAEAVARWRRGGAVVLGKTVTQEFAAGVISAPSRNPWDPERIPGGSSGGSAVAVAAGICPVALGSDTGGSVRIPAAACGVVGLKPTFGMIPTSGCFPLSPSLDTVGPIAGTVEDALFAYRALGGSGGPGWTTGDGDLRGVRIGVPGGWFAQRVQPGVRAAFSDAVTTLRSLGATIVEAPWPGAAAARAAAFLISRVEAAAVHRETMRDHPDAIGDALRGRWAAASLVSGSDYALARRARTAIRDGMARLFAAHRLDALATPTLPASAALAETLTVPHDDGDEDVGNAFLRLTMPFNTTGQPALSLPCGFDNLNLPIGLHLAGRPFEEGALCRIGNTYERAAGWSPRFPPPIAERDERD